MLSIPQAMTWEFWRKSRWRLLLSWGVMLALPTFIYSVTLLQTHDRGTLRQDGFIAFHFACLLIQALAFTAPILMTQMDISRFYPWPIATSTLVAWRLIPGMAAMALLSVGTAVVLNLMFDVGWPLVGPALFLATAYPLLQGAIWIGEKAPLVQVVLMSAVATCLGGWLQARHGGWFAPPAQMWSEVTSAEVATMLIVAAVGWCVAHVGLRRDRCGESLRWLRIYDWLEGWSFPGRPNARPFESPAHAQFWFEWRQKGLLMPVVVVVGLTMMGLIHLLGRVRPELLRPDDVVFWGVLTGSLLPFIGFLVGLVMGQTGGGRDKTVMGSFLASLPIEDGAFSRSISSATALSTLLAWGLWTLHITALYFLCGDARTRDTIFFGESEGPPGRWVFVALLFLTWTGASIGACAVKTGRMRLLVQVTGTLVALFVSWIFLAGLVWKLGPLGAVIALMLLAIAAILGTILGFVRAVERHLILPQVAWMAFVGWIAGCVVIEVLLSRIVEPSARIQSHVIFSIIGYGLAALAIAPVAIGPLAIAWNRHR